MGLDRMNFDSSAVTPGSAAQELLAYVSEEIFEPTNSACPSWLSMIIKGAISLNDIIIIKALFKLSKLRNGGPSP